MKKKFILSCAFVLILSFVLTGCTDSYQAGKITDNCYENESLNLKFTAPQGYQIKSGEDSEVEISSSGSGSSIILLVENPLASIGSTEKYIEALKNDISKEIDQENEKPITIGRKIKNHSFSDEITEVEIAGETYQKLSCTIIKETLVTRESTIKQDYYIRKCKNRIIVIIATYGNYGKSEAGMDELMNNFVTL
ncbi:MAG: hypothetical protein FWG14_02695 [Peptococcaceae bacterium]|nr:hypothetical protein [Peptococcaceae bacterium]